MSFTDNVKAEILQHRPKKPCCRFCESYGMTLVLRRGGRIRMKSASLSLARHYRSLLAKCTDISLDVRENGSRASFCADCSDFRKFYALDSVDSSVFTCENCAAAFFRGAFLASGNCSDPEKEYHLEIKIAGEGLSYELCRLLIGCGLDAKTREKPSKSAQKSENEYIVYLKKSGDIEDFLTLIGAAGSALAVMQSTVMKDVRNNINRKTNFETANIKKSSVSCAKQLEAINKLDRRGMLAVLPDDLRELAQARRENIDMSLSELGAQFGLSRAGVHHRLQKIIDKANALD